MTKKKQLKPTTATELDPVAPEVEAPEPEAEPTEATPEVEADTAQEPAPEAPEATVNITPELLVSFAAWAAASADNFTAIVEQSLVTMFHGTDIKVQDGDTLRPVQREDLLAISLREKALTVVTTAGKKYVFAKGLAYESL